MFTERTFARSLLLFISLVAPLISSFPQFLTKEEQRSIQIMKFAKVKVQTSWIIRDHTESSAPDTIRQIDFVFNRSGQKIEAIRYGDDGESKSRGQFSYDSFGRLSNRIEYNQDGSIFKTIEYFYDPKGQLISETRYTPYDPDGVVKKYFYDDQKRLTDETDNFGSGTGPHTQYKYDGSGNVVEESFEIVIPHLGPSRTICKYSHNLQGLPTQRQRIRDKEDVETTIFRYDSHDNLIEEVTHNSHEVTIASVKYFFDKKGLLVREIRYKDRTGQSWLPENEAIVYTYQYY